MRVEVARVLCGSLAGAVATAPMTTLMEAGHRRLPRGEAGPLPPREIVERLAGRADVPLPRAEERVAALALAGHFSYGALAGAIYGAGAPPSLREAATRGTLFGLAVWIASYLGWLPALGVLRPATRHPIRRTLLMVAAHLVWGASTGIATHALIHSRALSRQPRPAALDEIEAVLERGVRG